MLQKKIENEDIVINTLRSDFECADISSTNNNNWCNIYFERGWARRPKHGKTKGHNYMNDDHKEMIKGYFEEGNKDKGKKKSAALMIEAMKSECDNGEMHPKKNITWVYIQ